MRVVFAGGGTGGHIYPAVAVADELRSKVPRFNPLFVGTRGGLESTVVKEAGYNIRFIHSRGVRGRGFVRQVVTLASLAAGVVQSTVILSRFRPDLVFGSGGYASVAVLVAAFILRRRIVIQEQNSVPGLANRMLAPLAKRIYLGFEKAAGYLGNRSGIIVTGNPLRKEMLEERSRETRNLFGLSPDKPVLLVFGGSQGAGSLNRAAVDYLMAEKGIQGIVQTGKADYEGVLERTAEERSRIFVSAYITRIRDAYDAADLALARAGALSVSELAAVGLPAVLVPYPHAADDHQFHNAGILVDAGGALAIEDRALSGGRLAEIITPLAFDKARLERMKGALLAMSGRDAAAVIAEDIKMIVDGQSAGVREKNNAGPS